MVAYTIQHTKGDTFPGATITLSPEPGETVDILSATAKMQFRLNSKTGTLALTMEVGTGLTITSANTIVIDEQLISIASGLYYSDLQITIAGKVYTTIEIKWLISQDVTV